MPITFPFPVRVSVGLAAAGVEHLRKLPGELPTLGVTAAGQAMRLSMRVQQEFADLATRGDEVLSRFGGQPADQPAWATFDDDDTIEAGSLTSVAVGAEVAPNEDETGYSGDATQQLAEVIALDLVAVAQSADRAEDEEPDSDSEIETAAETDAATDAEGHGDAEAADADADGTFNADQGQHDDGTVPDIEVDDGATSATLVGSSVNGAVGGLDEYEALTLAELRGKLRRLSADQVTTLLDREQAGPDRPAFVTLLTNRLTSMEQGHP